VGLGKCLNHVGTLRERIVAGQCEWYCLAVKIRMLRRPLDVVLIGIFLASAAVIVFGQEDPFVRRALLGQVSLPAWLHAHAWRRVLYDLGVGSFLSVAFYGVVVRLPEHRKRQRIKRSFAKRYRLFKEDCIAEILSVADGTFLWGVHETLVDQAKFREYFREPVSSSQDRWDAFLNNLEASNLEVLITQLEILRDEIAFVLASTDINDDEPFEFFKRLSSIIALRRKTSLGYDGTKNFGNFLWEMFTGFSTVSGYREGDLVADMIKAI
jgi:hypothetical protein